MSGVRHHIVPRFLQRGFAKTKSSGNPFVWVFRKDKNPFEAITSNIGLEKHFYSIDGDSSVDDEITKVELKYSYLVKRLREKSKDCLDDNKLIAEMITHFEVRNKGIRVGFLEASDFLLNQAVDKFLEDDFLIFYIKPLLKNDKEIIRNEVMKFFGGAIPSGFSLIEIESFIANHIDAQLDSIVKGTTPMIRGILGDKIKNMLPGYIKKGHLKGIVESKNPTARSKRYESFKYSIHSSESTLPLGDSILIFEVQGVRCFKPFLEKDDVVTAVYLPLDSNSFLFGTSELTEPKYLELPQRIVECSLEYFISSENNERIRKLTPYIGSNSYLISNEELSSIVDSIVRDTGFLTKLT